MAAALFGGGFTTTACQRGEEPTEATEQAAEGGNAEQGEAAGEQTGEPSEGAAPIGADARIVSTAGAITELIYALGAADLLVGVDVSSVYPPAAHQFPKVGYNRALSSEGVASLDPTHVLVTPDAGPAEALTQIEATGANVIRLPNAVNPVEGAIVIRELAAALGKEEEGEELASRFEEEIEAARLESENDSVPRGAFVYARGAGTMILGGEDTAAETMFALAGAQNAVEAFHEYRPLTPEAIVAAAPDFIVVPARGLESLGGVDGLLRVPGVAQTQAAESRAVIAVDDLQFLGFGPRAPEAIRDLNASLRELGLVE